MKKLYNKQTGQVAELIKINVTNNHIVYNVYDASNEIIEVNYSVAYKFQDYNITDNLFQTVNTADECLKQLAVEKLTDFILEDENLNWLVDVNLRMFIPISWLSEVLITPSMANVANIITTQQQLNANATEPFIFKGDKYFVAYFNFIDTTPNEDGVSDYDIMLPHIYSEDNLDGKIIVETQV